MRFGHYLKDQREKNNRSKKNAAKKSMNMCEYHTFSSRLSRPAVSQYGYMEMYIFVLKLQA